MSDEIKFDLPLWGVTVYHNTPNTEGVWNRAFNAPRDGLAKMEKLMELFSADGLSWARIYSIEMFELKPLGRGGEDGNS